jgi:hypothetical protein
MLCRVSSLKCVDNGREEVLASAGTGLYNRTDCSYLCSGMRLLTRRMSHFIDVQNGQQNAYHDKSGECCPRIIGKFDSDVSEFRIKLMSAPRCQ